MFLESILNFKKELFLSSYEYYDFEEVRTIKNYNKIKIESRNVLKVSLDKPIIGDNYGLLGTDINIAYLINRESEDSFDLLNSFPIDVYVLIPKYEYLKYKINRLDYLQNIAWASIYDNEADAKIHSL